MGWPREEVFKARKDLRIAEEKEIMTLRRLIEIS